MPATMPGALGLIVSSTSYPAPAGFGGGAGCEITGVTGGGSTSPAVSLPVRVRAPGATGVNATVFGTASPVHPIACGTRFAAAGPEGLTEIVPVSAPLGVSVTVRGWPTIPRLEHTRE